MARDATAHLGQEQWHLLQLSRGQGAGESRLVRVDEAAPDALGVEFRMFLGTRVLLLGHDLEIELPDLLPAQIYALVGEEMCGRAEDIFRAVLGLDPDQGAVHVERDRSDIHACILPERATAGRSGARRSGGLKQPLRLSDEPSA